MPIQQMFLGSGIIPEKLYIDDVFSTYLYTGTYGVQTINNGLKLATGLNLPLGTFIQGGYFQGTFTDNSVDYALIVAPIGAGNNNGTMVSYGSSSTSAGATSLTNGPANTATLAAASGSWPAADWAYALSLNGYSDWYLPAKDELTLLQQNQDTLPSGQAWVHNWDTWSSTEINSTYAWMIQMSGGNWSNTDNKTKTRNVRAIRRVTVASLSSYNVTGAGGLVWIKQRNSSNEHVLFDTVRGATKAVVSSSNAGETTISDGLTSFLPYGFKIDDNARTGASTDTYSSWAFRNAPGFCDVVKFSVTNSSNQRVSHSLKCVPGLILFKRLSGNGSWVVYHRDLGPDAYLRLNLADAKMDSQTGYFGPDGPTATDFGIKSNAFWDYGPPPDEIIAYVFAGGESKASEAVSVDFDGNDALASATSSDLSLGTGDYTVEMWFNADTVNDSPLFENRVSGVSSDTTGFTLTAHGSTNGVRIWWNGASRINGGGSSLSQKQWHHLAATRASGTTYLFLDGTLLGTTTDSIDITTTEAHIGGGKYSGGTAISHYYDGKISNVRIIKGTALYTSSFRPPTEPLTNITNTKLLCCQSSTVTTATVAPGTITAVGDPTASTDSPFDDPAGFKFGDAGEGIVKCGSFTTDGNGAATVNIGWEPSFVIMKRTDGGAGWYTFDSMRGFPVDGNSERLSADDNGGDSSMSNYNVVSSSGFSVNNINTNSTHVFFAIRHPDGYVSRPVEDPTSVFAMDTGAGNSDIPNFDSNFPVDFGILRKPATTQDWFVSARLIEGRYLRQNTSASETTYGNYTFDSNVGWVQQSVYNSSYQSWMWKRHVGFDLVAARPKTGVPIRHGCNAVPEMIWAKDRDQNAEWSIYHKNLNGGTNPEQYRLKFTVDAEHATSNAWDDTAPTATHFTTGSWMNNNDMLFMLFSSVEGISKCGGYSGSSSVVTVDCGFVPRLVIIKKRNNTGGWLIFDTLRGITAGNDCYMFLDSTAADVCSYDVLDLVDSGGVKGFSVPTLGSNNDNGSTYIYYAHS